MLYFAVVLNYLLLLNFLHGLFLLWLLGFIVVTLLNLLPNFVIFNYFC